MITGLNLDETVDYTLESDKENPTVWKLGVVPSYLFVKMFSNGSVNDIDTIFKLLQVSLKGWDNFNIPFRQEKQTICGREMDVVPLDILERIRITDLTELARKVLEVNQISENERKN